jgi:uncharacterized protein (UPF0216 family)
LIETFNRDLKRGKHHENVILEVIQKKYPKAFIKDGYCKEYDIFIPELKIGVEVKSDEKSKFTGNIVIEIEFNKRPSALITSKAKYWVIFDGYDYHWFLKDKIKDCILENKLKWVEFIGKGDTKSKKAYLIKKEILYKYKL